MKYSDGKYDKFYTKQNIAKQMIKKFNLDKYDCVIEPSAGVGSFSNNINHKNLISLDINPDNESIIKQDWFEYKIDKKLKNVLVIGNPPFGKRNKLSQKFIKHAASFEGVKTIAFILPNVFNKYTLQKCIPPEFKIKKILQLPKKSFYNDEGDVNIPCSMFVMQRGGKKDLRQKTNLISSHFEFTTKEDEFDFYIFGSAPKKIILYEEKNKITKNNRGYYIKSMIDKNKLIDNIKKMFWKGYSSVNGEVYWLTQTDIKQFYIKEYEGEKNE